MIRRLALTIIWNIADDYSLIRRSLHVYFINANAQTDQNFAFFKYSQIFPGHGILIYNNGIAVPSLNAYLSWRMAS